MTYFYYSIIISNFLLTTAFIYGVSSKQLRVKKNVRWSLYFLGFVLVIEILIKTRIYLFCIKDVSFIYPFYIAGEFFILTRLFMLQIQLSIRWNFLILGFSVFVFSEAACLWYDGQLFSSVYGKVFSHLTIICMAAYLLIKNLKEIEVKTPFFFVYAALFTYYAVSLFLFLLMNQLTKSNIVIWTMNNILSSILYSSFIYTFYKLKKW
jgi:hypothetical protein